MKTFQLGITGGIGSGKSVVCRVLEVLGIPVFNADEASKQLLENNHDVIYAVKKLLGTEAYQTDGKANRQFIAGIVFTDENKLQQLNNILHPAVQKNYKAWVAGHQHLQLVAKEAAIMFESGSYAYMDAIVAVTAPAELRINRVVERDGKRPADVLKILNRQLPEEEIIRRSNFKIINDDEHLIIPQILTIIEQIKTIKT
ncbi:MAG: dephospho-CoA kinase [Bacteroidota bacterium]|nr:dephospho-CoA kinase [Bacteroidota bacterium]